MNLQRKHSYIDIVIKLVIGKVFEKIFVCALLLVYVRVKIKIIYIKVWNVFIKL